MNLIQQLADAKAQYHLLVTGQSVRVFIDQNGEQVQYVAAKASDLMLYINKLQGQFDVVAGGTPAVSGPMRVFM